MRKINNSIIIITVIILCLLIFTGCSMITSTTQTPTEEANATPVPAKKTDADYKLADKLEYFSIEYNSNWILKEPLENDKSSKIIITIPEDSEKSSDGKTLPYINVIYTKINDVETFSLEDETKKNIEYLKNNIYNFTVFSIEGESEYKPAKIGGEDAYIIEYAGSISNTNEARFKQIFTAKNGRMFTITYAASYDYYIDEDYKAIVDKTLDSFNFK